MPMSEEERRRCILLGGCAEGARVEALADVLDEMLQGHEPEKETPVTVLARELLAGGWIGKGEKQAAPPEEESAAE